MVSTYKLLHSQQTLLSENIILDTIRHWSWFSLSFQAIVSSNEKTEIKSVQRSCSSDHDCDSLSTGWYYLTRHNLWKGRMWLNLTDLGAIQMLILIIYTLYGMILGTQRCFQKRFNLWSIQAESMLNPQLVYHNTVDVTVRCFQKANQGKETS